MEVKYVNDILFYELDNSLYYIITYVIGYLLNHFNIKMNMHMNFILTIGTICYLPQRSNSAIKTQWFISKFNDIGYILNTHANLRNSVSKALFILIQQNNIIMLVTITKACTDTIKMTMVIVQQIQVVKRYGT